MNFILNVHDLTNTVDKEARSFKAPSNILYSELLTSTASSFDEKESFSGRSIEPTKEIAHTRGAVAY